MCDIFACEICNYETKRLANLNKHKLTNKHIKNIEYGKLICKYCGKKFAQQSGLSRHEKHRCNMNIVKSKSAKLIEALVNEKLEVLVNENKKLVEQTQKMANDFSEQNKNLIYLASKNADASIINAKSTKKSLSMISYANKNLKKAPALKLLEHKEAVKLLTYDKSSKHSLGTRIVFNYKSKILDKFLGDMIVVWYKKDNPDDQSIWSTDTSRLSFILMNIFSETGKKEWNADKKGLKIKKMIILPILEEIKKELILSIDEWSSNIDKIDDAKSCYENIIIAKDIILEITKDTIADEILKYIAPEFGFNLSQSKKTINEKCCKCNKSSNDYHTFNNKYYCDVCLSKLLQ